MKNKKILLVCNDTNAVINFRKELIIFLGEHNFSVDIIAADNVREKELNDIGATLHVVPYNNRSTNPFAIISSTNKISKIVKAINPDVIFTFQVKATIFGVEAARRNKIDNVFSMVEGLGDPFQPKGLRGKLIQLIVSMMYRKSFKTSKRIFLLNNDDKKLLVERKILKEDKAVVIHGIGIDIKKYSPNYVLPKEKRVLMLSRLIINKGVYDFCEIAKKVKETRKDVVFDIYGAESQLRVSDLQKYIESGAINYRGYVKDVSEVVLNSRIILLPTVYREGFPRSIMEAAALGRIVIGTNNVGVVDAIEDGKTGFLIKKHDIDGFANKIIEIIDNDELLIKLGKSARKKCEEECDSDVINNIILNVIENNCAEKK